MVQSGTILEVNGSPRSINAGTPLVVLALLLCTANLARGQGQAYFRHPEVIEGPWEFTSSFGIYGVFINIETHEHGPNSTAKTTDQAFNIRVYHREHASETWGWFGKENFKGNRLILTFEDIHMDFIFRPEGKEWTGAWSRRGELQNVVLRRPHPPPGSKPNALVGNWQRLPNSNRPSFPGSLHIRESSDGTFTAWIDRTLGGLDCHTRSVDTDQRNGELLHLVYMRHGRISIETTPSLGMGPTFDCVGTASAGGSRILGTWSNVGGEWLTAPDNFRRVP